MNDPQIDHRFAASGNAIDNRAGFKDQVMH
jgi:hypothetical protein